MPDFSDVTHRTLIKAKGNSNIDYEENSQTFNGDFIIETTFQKLGKLTPVGHHIHFVNSEGNFDMVNLDVISIEENEDGECKVRSRLKCDHPVYSIGLSLDT